MVLSGLGVVLLRMRKESENNLSPDEELIPSGSALHSGSKTERRAMALETGSAGEVLSKSVSDDEISDVISSSAPSLLLQCLFLLVQCLCLPVVYRKDGRWTNGLLTATSGMSRIPDCTQALT